VNTELLNEKEIYQANDTITIVSSFPKTLTDYMTPYPKEVYYGNATPIGGNVIARVLDSVNHQLINAMDSFSVVSIVGSVEDVSGQSDQLKSLSFQETNDDYQLKILLILRKKGNYIINMSGFYCRGLKGENCTNAGFNNTITNTNKHLDLLINTQIPGFVLDQTIIDHSYCFRVQ